MEINIKIIHSHPAEEEMIARLYNRMEEHFKTLTDLVIHLKQKTMGFFEDVQAKLSAIDDKNTLIAADVATVKQGVIDLKTSIGNSDLTPIQKQTILDHLDAISTAADSADANLKGIDTSLPDQTGTGDGTAVA